MKIRVLLADDHAIMREGLRVLLEAAGDIAVVGAAANGRQAVQLTRELGPDLVIMDIAMPGMNGIEAIRQISGDMPEIKVMALSMHSDRRYVTEALAAGARGYLLKDCDSADLLDAIRFVVSPRAGERPKATGLIVTDPIEPSRRHKGASGAKLTSREREVLQLVAEGKNTKEIAFLLNVSIKTVETHRQQVMKKLDIFSVAELTKYAIREGITSL